MREPGYSQDTPTHAMPPEPAKETRRREPGYSRDILTLADPPEPTKETRRREPSYSWDTPTLADSPKHEKEHSHKSENQGKPRTHLPHNNENKKMKTCLNRHHT